MNLSAARSKPHVGISQTEVTPAALTSDGRHQMVVKPLDESILDELKPESALLVRLKIIQDLLRPNSVASIPSLQIFTIYQNIQDLLCNPDPVIRNNSWELVLKFVENHVLHALDHSVMELVVRLNARSSAKLRRSNDYFSSSLSLSSLVSTSSTGTAVKEFFHIDLPDVRSQFLVISYLLREDRVPINQRMTALLLHWVDFIRVHSSQQVEPLFGPFPMLHELLTFIREVILPRMDGMDCAPVISSISLLSQHISDTQDIEDSLDLLDNLKDQVSERSISQYIFALCKFVHINPRRAYFDLLLYLFMRFQPRELISDALFDIMTNTSFHEHIAVIRGAVFFITASMWSNDRVQQPPLDIPCDVVLYAFQSASRLQSPFINYELLISIHRLLRRHSNQLEYESSNSLVDLIYEIRQHFPGYPEGSAATTDSGAKVVNASISQQQQQQSFQHHNLQHQQNGPSRQNRSKLNEEVAESICSEYSSIVQLLLTKLDEQSYKGDRQRLLDTLCRSKAFLRENQILQMLQEYCLDERVKRKIHILNHLLDIFFYREQRSAVRLKALQLLFTHYSTVVSPSTAPQTDDGRGKQQDCSGSIAEMLCEVVLPLIQRLDEESDPEILRSIYPFIKTILSAHRGQYVDALLNLLEKCAVRCSAAPLLSSTPKLSRSAFPVALLIDYFFNCNELSALSLCFSALCRLCLSLDNINSQPAIISRPSSAKQQASIAVPADDPSREIAQLPRMACFESLLSIHYSKDNYQYCSLSANDCTSNLGRSPVQQLLESTGFSGINGDLQMTGPILLLSSDLRNSRAAPNIDFAEIIRILERVLTTERSWEVFEFVSSRVPDLLTTRNRLFADCTTSLSSLLTTITDVIANNRIPFQLAGQSSGIRRGYVYLLLYRALYALIPYRHCFTKHQQDEIVSTFSLGLQKYNSTASAGSRSASASTPRSNSIQQQQQTITSAARTASANGSNTTKFCVDALTVCALQLPVSLMKYLSGIVARLSMVMTTTRMSLCILDFLASISVYKSSSSSTGGGGTEIGNLLANFTDEDYKRVFGIALQYIRSHHRRPGAVGNSPSPLAHGSGGYAPSSSGSTPLLQRATTHRQPQQHYFSFNHQRSTAAAQTGGTASTEHLSPAAAIDRQMLLAENSFSEYVLQMAYHVIMTWFIKLRPADRQKYISFITRGLAMAQGHIFPPGAPSMPLSLATTASSQRPSLAPAMAESPNNNNAASTTNAMMNRRRPSSASTAATIPSPLAQRASSFHSQSFGSLQQQQQQHSIIILDERSEVCYDILQKYALYPKRCSSPSRSMTAVYQGPGNHWIPQKSWAVGHSIITVYARKQADSHHESNGSAASVDTTVKLVIRRASGVHSYLIESDDGDSEIGGQEEGGLDPLRLAAHLYGYSESAGRQPLLLPDDPTTARALSVLDHTPTLDLHKIGVIYVGKELRNGTAAAAAAAADSNRRLPFEEQAVLGIDHSQTSATYRRFLNDLGRMEELAGYRGFTGGLDTSSDQQLDGSHGLFWHDEGLCCVSFHVATLICHSLPANESRQPQPTALMMKKRHVGNDYVRIIFDDSGQAVDRYELDTIAGQFNFVNLIVTPLYSSYSVEEGSRDDGNDNLAATMFRVTMQTRSDMPNIGPLGDEPKIIDGCEQAAVFVRQVALCANVYAQIFQQLQKLHYSSTAATTAATELHPSDLRLSYEYVSNLRERLRQLKRCWERMDHATTANDGLAAFFPTA